MKYFVTAIGTDSGKTFISAILTKALQCDYWKPIQCGEPADSEVVEYLLDNPHSMVHRERFKLKTAASPHMAAQVENVKISLNDFILPNTDGHALVIEGAGGALVPINDEEVVLDLATRFDCKVILVCNHYLGSINHTLLTAEVLKRRHLHVKGIIFNNVENSASTEEEIARIKSSEEIILKKTGYKSLLRVAKEEFVSQELVMRYAIKLFEHWDE